jgi:hypothetical protein
MGLYAARDIEIGEELLLQKVSDIPDCGLMGKLFGAFPHHYSMFIGFQQPECLYVELNVVS